MKFELLLILSMVFISCKENQKLKFYNRKFEGIHTNTGNARHLKEEKSKIITYHIPETAIEFPLDSILEPVLFIPLETTPEVMIGDVSGLFFLEQYIIVVDKSLSKGVFIFDQDGKFLRKVSGYGSGADEYGEITDVTIDEDNNLIIILDNERSKLFYYNLEGKLVTSRNAGLRFNEVIYAGGDTLLLYSKNSGNDHYPSIDSFSVLFLKDLKEVVFADFPEPAYLRDFHYFSRRHINKCGGKIYLFPRFSDTVFRLDPRGNRTSLYKLDYPKLVPPNFFRNDLNKRMFRGKIGENGYYYFMGFFQENSTTIFTLLNGGAKSNSFSNIIINRNTGNVLNVSGFRMEKNYNFPGFQYPILVAGDKFVSAIPSSRLLQLKEFLDSSWVKPENFSAEIRRLFTRVQPNGNPILMVYNFKEF